MGKKDDAFVLKERGVVTTTIQGGSYDPYRIVFDNDDIQVSKSDYNAYRIILKNTYTEPIDISEYFDDLWSVLKADGVCAFTVTDATLGATNFVGSKVTYYAGQGNATANMYACRGVTIGDGINAGIDIYSSTKLLWFSRTATS